MEIIKKLLKHDVRMFPSLILGLFYVFMPMLCAMDIITHLTNVTNNLQAIILILAIAFYVCSVVTAIRIIKDGSLTQFFNETHELWWTMLLSGIVIEFTYYIGLSVFSVIAIIVVFACLYSGSLRRRYVREKQSKQNQKVD